MPGPEAARTMRYSPRLPVWLALGAILIPMGGCKTLDLVAPERVETGLVTRTYRSAFGATERRYAMYIPQAYNQTNRDWPVILFLHGAGERGEMIDLVYRHGPIKEGLLSLAFPFIVIAPQCPSDSIPAGDAWGAREPDVLRILAEVTRDYRVDRSRVYLTGLSMGGFGAFQIAADHPELFAAVAPICGGGSPMRARDYRGTPFWIFHGALDTVVPAGRSREMYESMKAMDQDVRITIYPDLGHDAWTRTYQSGEFYDWLLSHQLPDSI